MSLFLRVRVGSKTKDVAILQQGTPVAIGRLPENDVDMPNDDQMSSRHATLVLSGDTCELRDLNSTNGTTVNGEPVTTTQLRHGDSFRCGLTEFVIDWPTQPGILIDSGTAVADPDVSGSVVTASQGTAPNPADEDLCQQEIEIEAGYISEVADEVVAKFQLAKKITLAPEVNEPTQEFAERLLSANDGLDSLHFLAFALPRRLAVWWALECIRRFTDSNELDRQILDLIEAWVNVQTDKHRRAAAELVELEELESAASMAARAAFHAHGSSAPAHGPYVGSPYNLAGTLVFVAVTLASSDGDPDAIAEQRNKFIQLAGQISSGEESLLATPAA